MTVAFTDLVPGFDGLVPAVVQDATDGSVLMVGYMDEEAFSHTLESGLVTFWSRSRQERWTKGGTSGNTLALVSMEPDCDADTLLVRAHPAGPTCHTGMRSCFGEGRTSLGAMVDRLEGVIESRRHADQASSYSATLLADPSLAARKVLEEAGEVAFAAKDLLGGVDDADLVAEEAADVVYHLLALLASVGVRPEMVAEVLADRRR